MLDCIDKEDTLIDYAIELGLSGIAITDHECIGGHIKAMNYLAGLKRRRKKFLKKAKRKKNWNGRAEL